MATTAKKDLAERVAEEADRPRSLALQLVDAGFEAMRERLLAGDRVEIRDFGTLCVRWARARPPARNPRTGETVRVPGVPLQPTIPEPLAGVGGSPAGRVAPGGCSTDS